MAIASSSKLLFIAILGLTAPLFHVRFIGSISLFDLVLLLGFLGFMPRKFHRESVFLFCLFSILALTSEYRGVYEGYGHPATLADSINIILRYLIFLFFIPHLSAELFYGGDFDVKNFKIFNRSLAFGYLLVLLQSAYAIFFVIEDYFLFGRFSSVYGNPNTAALVFNMMSILLIFQIQRDVALHRFIAIVSLFLSLYALVYTGSFSGLLIQSCIFIYFAVRRFGVLFPTILLLFSIALGSSEAFFWGAATSESRGLSRFIQFVNIVSSIGEVGVLEVGSAGERLTSIYMSLNALLESPILFLVGIGFGAVESFVYSQTGHPTSVHLVYLQMTLSIGLIGSLIYVYLFLRLVGRAGAVDRRFGLSHQFVVSIVTFLSLGLFIPHTYMGFYYAPLIPVLGCYWYRR